MGQPESRQALVGTKKRSWSPRLSAAVNGTQPSVDQHGAKKCTGARPPRRSSSRAKVGGGTRARSLGEPGTGGGRGAGQQGPLARGAELASALARRVGVCGRGPCGDGGDGHEAHSGRGRLRQLRLLRMALRRRRGRRLGRWRAAERLLLHQRLAEPDHLRRRGGGGWGAAALRGSTRTWGREGLARRGAEEGRGNARR